MSWFARKRSKPSNPKPEITAKPQQQSATVAELVAKVKSQHSASTEDVQRMLDFAEAATSEMEACAIGYCED